MGVEPVSSPELAAGLALVRRGLDAVRAAGVSANHAQEAVDLQRHLAVIERQVTALQVDAVADVEAQGWHTRDGHATAKVLVRHVCRTSNAQAGERVRLARALRALPALRAAFADGAVPVSHADLVARAWANPRVRAALVDEEDAFVQRARNWSHRDFQQWVADWVRRVDEDGTCDRSQRLHEQRDIRLTQGFDDGWTLTGRLGTIHGAELHSIFERFCRAELEADLAEARQRLGDSAAIADLGRTVAQRRADAWVAMSRKAADAWAAAPGGSVIRTVIGIDHATFERRLATLFGFPTGSIDPAEPSHFRCDTIDGHRVDPTEVTLASLVGTVRRAVYGADGVVLDLGRNVRLFTGDAQLAVRLANSCCGWTGCEVPSSACQSDHLESFNGPTHGSTCPGNGAPMCGRHNRFKEHGFTVRRSSDGTITVHRPDGTLID